MTLVSDIIQQSYRETNLIPLGATPTDTQNVEGLARLNAIITSAVGNEIAEPGFRDITIGGDYDQSDLISNYVPDNVRLVVNLEDGGIVVGLHPSPYEGQRVAIADVAGNFSTYNVVIEGNGRKIEDAESITLSDDSIAKQWMYRADTGNWVLITPITILDDMPFPAEFDDYFVTMLALRLSPRYGQMLPAETIQILKRSRGQLRSRYRNRTYVPYPDPGLINPQQWGYYASSGDDGFELGKDWINWPL
jgi:hypothetical protein